MSANSFTGGGGAVTAAQLRLLEEIRRQGGADGGAEFWPVVNDWVKDTGPSHSLALHNINRSVEALVRRGVVRIDDQGLFHLVEVTQ